MTDQRESQQPKIENLESHPEELTPGEAEQSQGGGGYADAYGGYSISPRDPAGTPRLAPD